MNAAGILNTASVLMITSSITSTAGRYLLKTGCKSDVAKLNEMFTRHRKELEDAIAGDKTGQGFICDMFLQELENHEYSYTGDVQETLDALGITAQYMESVPQLLDGLALACEKAMQHDCFD